MKNIDLFSSSPYCRGCSWHLWGVLTSLWLQSTHSWQSAYIHCSYASQLVASGEWQWAVFVAMHLSDAELRQKQVVEILQQHCSGDEELSAEEEFVVEELRVPKRLVYQAKVCISIVPNVSWCTSV